MQIGTEYVAEKMEQQSSAVQRLQIGELPLEIEGGRRHHEVLQDPEDADPVQLLFALILTPFQSYNLDGHSVTTSPSICSLALSAFAV